MSLFYLLSCPSSAVCCPRAVCCAVHAGQSGTKQPPPMGAVGVASLGLFQVASNFLGHEMSTEIEKNRRTVGASIGDPFEGAGIVL